MCLSNRVVVSLHGHRLARPHRVSPAQVACPTLHPVSLYPSLAQAAKFRGMNNTGLGGRRPLGYCSISVPEAWTSGVRQGVLPRQGCYICETSGPRRIKPAQGCGSYEVFPKGILSTLTHAPHRAPEKTRATPGLSSQGFKSGIWWYR